MAAAAHNNLFMWLGDDDHDVDDDHDMDDDHDVDDDHHVDGDDHKENDDDIDCNGDDHDNDVVVVVMKILNGRLLHSIS